MGRSRRRGLVITASKVAQPICKHQNNRIWYLSGWSGTLATDGYGPYFSLPGVTNIACLAH